MDLCFLLERRYAPYSKWFGTAFAELACAPQLIPRFQEILRAAYWQERDAALAAAYELIAGLHNERGITEPVDPHVRYYHGGRPFQVIHGERFAEAIVATIEDAQVRAVVECAGLIGSVDQISDNVDVVSNPERVAKLRALYG
jgi:hypothetical protein